jgi:hypothetical protein
MANTLQRMQRDGLVDCVPDRTDRRRMRVKLTERARTLEPDLAAAARAVNAAATQGLSDEEVAAFMRITGTVIQNLAGDTGGNDLSTPCAGGALVCHHNQAQASPGLKEARCPVTATSSSAIYRQDSFEGVDDMGHTQRRDDGLGAAHA